MANTKKVRRIRKNNTRKNNTRKNKSKKTRVKRGGANHTKKRISIKLPLPRLSLPRLSLGKRPYTRNGTKSKSWRGETLVNATSLFKGKAKKSYESAIYKAEKKYTNNYKRLVEALGTPPYNQTPEQQIVTGNPGKHSNLHRVIKNGPTHSIVRRTSLGSKPSFSSPLRENTTPHKVLYNRYINIKSKIANLISQRQNRYRNGSERSQSKNPFESEKVIREMKLGLRKFHNAENQKLEGLKKQANNLATKLKGGPYGHSSSFA